MNNIIIKGRSTYYLIIIIIINNYGNGETSTLSFKKLEFRKENNNKQIFTLQKYFHTLRKCEREKEKKNKTHENNNAKMEEKWRKCTCMVSLVSKMKEEYSTETAS